MDEQRRYFPDWTIRPLERRPELEADHNSYLAGGYAEEFGYRAAPGYSRGVPVLDGESPEECIECQGQARATHPGYPIRPHPFQIDFERSGPKQESRSLHESGRTESGGEFVPVSNRPYEHSRRNTSQKVVAVSMRFAAAIIGLRWKLRRPTL
jgi:hypothetical protein